MKNNIVFVIASCVLCGCSGEKSYEIVTESGVQEGWVLVLPAKLEKEYASWDGKVLFADKRSGKKYTVPFTFETKVKYAQYLALQTYKEDLPVQGTSNPKASADIEIRAGGILGKNMSTRHPVWREMEERGLKESDIIDADRLDIVIKDNIIPYFQLRSGRYPYLVPKS